MIETVLSLLMNYFPDNRPVLLSTLRRRCADIIIEQALHEGYIQKTAPDSNGGERYMITGSGREYRDHFKEDVSHTKRKIP